VQELRAPACGLGGSEQATVSQRFWSRRFVDGDGQGLDAEIIFEPACQLFRRREGAWLGQSGLHVRVAMGGFSRPQPSRPSGQRHDLDFDAAVLGLAGSTGVGGDGLGFTKALDREAPAVELLGDKVLGNRIGAAAGEFLVVVIGAGPVWLLIQLWLFAQHDGDRIQHVIEGLLDVRLSVAKVMLRAC
jgi:hypothetical protein